MQYRIRELMILMAVLPPVGGWLWFAHNVPPSPAGTYGPFDFQHVRANSGFDIGAITVAVVTMGLLIMAATAFNRRSEMRLPQPTTTAVRLFDE